MDDAGFDRLTRRLAASGSRRRAVIAAVGGALGLVLGTSSGDEAAAGKRCPPSKERHHGRCRKNRPNDTPCKGTGKC